MSQESVVPITEDQLKPYYHKIYQQANRIAAGFLIGFFVLGILLALVHNTFLIGLTMGGLSLLLYFVIRSVAPGSELLRWVTSFLFWNFGVQFLLQMGGQSEIKYVFFIALTVLLFYENWKVFVPATLYALATVIYLNTAQDTEFFKTHFFNATPMSMTSFVIDMLSVLFFSVLCMGWARLQHAQTRESAKQAIMMEQQLSMMNANITFANSISQGNLKSDYTAHHADKLGQSLLNMRESLISAAEREEREKFANLGLARIGEILRQHADNLGKLCDQIIEEVIKYMKANQGSIFVMEGHDHDRHLVLMASRAWDRKKFSQKSIQIGEGLVGQAAIEKHTIFMTQVPEDYITITSGLGQANPRSILIVPLQADDTVVGVIELASFRIYQDYEIKFLEKVGESIASMVITTKNNEKNRELLNKSNLLTEQMRAQEEEIRQNMEEMQATQEEMHRKNREIERLLKIAGEKEAELQKQLEEVQKIKVDGDRKSEELIRYMQNYRNTLLSILDELPHKIFLKDNEGKMVLVNTAVAKAHNMSVDELIGKSDFDFVDAETAQQWRNQELEIIRKGSETYIFNEALSGETKTLKSTKMAFYIPHLDQTGLLGIQTDITEIQRLKQQAELSKS